MSKLELSKWPALTGDTEWPDQLLYEKAIWGKAHNASSDFRWLAATPGFLPGSSEISQQLYTGDDTVPLACPLWQNSGGNCYAVMVCPSRAIDSFERRGFVEKHILQWKRPASVPAALGMWVLLPLVMESTDALWWDRNNEVDWANDEAFLELTQQPPALVNEQLISQQINQGIKDLLESIEDKSLFQLYLQLVMGEENVLHDQLPQTMTPQALAALTLPLDRALADTISMTGWIPSQRINNLNSLLKCWNAILCGEIEGLQLTRNSRSSKKQRKIANKMIDQLLHYQSLEHDLPQISTIDDTLAVVATDFDVSLWGASAAGKTMYLGQLCNRLEDLSGPWKIEATGQSLDFVENADKIVSNCRFPDATARGEALSLQFKIYNEESGLTASLLTEDRSGADLVEMNEETRNQMLQVSGLILLIDPTEEKHERERDVRKALRRMGTASNTGSGKENRPVAICFSKSDVLIKTADDYWQALDQNLCDDFIRQKLKHKELFKLLDAYLSNYTCFPISSVGVRQIYGVIEPSVYLDELAEPRIAKGGRILNLVEPFAWLYQQHVNLNKQTV